MKYLLLPMFLLFINFQSFSQGTPPNGKPGDIYCYYKDTGEYIKVKGELLQILKKGNLKGLQYQLKDLGYDVEVTGCIDKKTVVAFETNKKRLKREKRKVRKKTH